VGRSRATDTQLVDPHVARVHCQLQYQGGQYLLSDFESDGGTFVNGVRVGEHKLQIGDIIRIGNTRLQFSEDNTPTRAAAPAAALPIAMPIGPPPKGALPVAVAVSGPRGPAWVNALIGQTISHFKIGSPLARSKSGYIFHARDTRKNVPVALKVLDPEFSSNDAAVHRFVEAMKLVMPLRHANLIKFHGAGKTGGHCWIAMEYVEGESLAAVIGRIETTGMIDWRQVARVGVQLGRALDYAHSKKLVHQSVAPQNILLAKKEGRVKLSDLMLATAIDGDPTQPISAAGVPSEELSYMPPERTDGPGKPVDARADMYSLGATLYAMLAGHPPFQAPTVAELVAKIRLEAPTALKTLHPGIPEELDHLIVKSLAKRPEDRFATIREMVKRLEAIAKPAASAKAKEPSR
jgi:serine/threonine protein kinase